MSAPLDHIADVTASVLSERLRVATSRSAPPPAPAPASRARRDVAPPRVLVVDDDDDVREAGAQWLGDSGFDVLQAGSGADALVVLDEEDFDVVVLDLMMPGVSGWDVWDALQARGGQVPVVVWTASGLKTGAVGAAIVVSKSSDPVVLLDALRDVLSR